MKFGIFLLLQSPDMRPSQETYDHALEQGVLADQLGFDYIVAAEHHFSSYGFLPSPLLLIPVLAERTKQIRFSTAVVVLPLRNPIQLAEEIAMLDLVTRGRVEVGFGTGYQQYEFQRFGVNLAENRAMFEEVARAHHQTAEHGECEPPGPLLEPTRDHDPAAPYHQAPSAVLAGDVQRADDGLVPGAWDQGHHRWHLQQHGTGHQQLVSVPGCRRGGQGQLAPGVHYQPGRVRLGHRGRCQGHDAPCHLAYAHGPWPVLQLPAGQCRPGDD